MGVTVIAVLNIIGGAIMALAALGALGAGPELDLEPEAASAVAIFLMALAALQITVSVGLLRLRNWARITAVVLYSLGVLFGFIGLVSGSPAGLFQLVIGLVAAIYLSSEGVRDAFNDHPIPATWSRPSETSQGQSEGSGSSSGFGTTL